MTFGARIPLIGLPVVSMQSYQDLTPGFFSQVVKLSTLFLRIGHVTMTGFLSRFV